MKKYFLVFFFAFLFANLLALDALVIQSRVALQGSINDEVSPSLAKPCDFSCPKACLDKIEEATASIKAEKTESTPAAKIVTVVVTPPATALKEFYVQLNTGTGEGNDWKDVERSEIAINLSQFSKVKNIYFEVAGYLRNDNVTGNVRLYNYSDKQPVWNSEVTINKLKCQTSTSAAISLPLSTKTYRLQVKATLNATVYIDQARLRIVAE
jgi:hypothetical protein